MTEASSTPARMTMKPMHRQMLEHADKLHAESFVPALVRFPTLKGVMA